MSRPGLACFLFQQASYGAAAASTLPTVCCEKGPIAQRLKTIGALPTALCVLQKAYMVS